MSDVIGYACSRTMQVVWDNIDKFGPCDQCVPIRTLPVGIDDARTEATTLRADVERLRARTHELQEGCDKKVSGMQAEMRESRFWVDAYKEAERALAEYREQDGIAQHSIFQHMAYAVLLHRLAALEAAAREGPSDEVCRVILERLDDYANNIGAKDYHLPMYFPHIETMRAIIRAALATPTPEGA